MSPKFEKLITLFPFEKVTPAPRATCPLYELMSRSADIVWVITLQCSNSRFNSVTQPDFFVTAPGCEVQQEQNWRCKGFAGRIVFHLKLPCDAIFNFMNSILQHSVFQDGRRVYTEWKKSLLDFILHSDFQKGVLYYSFWTTGPCDVTKGNWVTMPRVAFVAFSNLWRLDQMVSFNGNWAFVRWL